MESQKYLTQTCDATMRAIDILHVYMPHKTSKWLLGNPHVYGLSPCFIDFKHKTTNFKCHPRTDIDFTFSHLHCTFISANPVFRQQNLKLVSC